MTAAAVVADAARDIPLLKQVVVEVEGELVDELENALGIAVVDFVSA